MLGYVRIKFKSDTYAFLSNQLFAKTVKKEIQIPL